MEGTVHFVVLTTILLFTIRKCDDCYFTFKFLKESRSLRQEGVPEGTCSCAVFSVPGIEPILEHTLQYNVSCDQEGTEKCQQLCIVLAETAQNKASMLICEKLNVHIENLKAAVYMKSCNMAFWTFTGLESTDPICCHEGNAVVCEAMSITEN